MIVKFEQGAGIEIGRGPGDLGRSLNVGDRPTSRNSTPTTSRPDLRRRPCPTASPTRWPARPTRTSWRTRAGWPRSSSPRSTTTRRPRPTPTRLTQVATTIVAAAGGRAGRSRCHQPSRATSRRGAMGRHQARRRLRRRDQLGRSSATAAARSTPPRGPAPSNVLEIEINPVDDVGADVLESPTTTSPTTSTSRSTCTPNALLAGDPHGPLDSGDPFIHGNVFQRNGYNGVGVQGGTDGGSTPRTSTSTRSGPAATSPTSSATRSSSGRARRRPPGAVPTLADHAPAPSRPPRHPHPPEHPARHHPGRRHDGRRPGHPADHQAAEAGRSAGAARDGANPAAAIPNSYTEGAGFIVGVDNGVDPTADPLIDPGPSASSGSSASGPTRPPARPGSRSSSPRSTTTPSARPSAASR